MNQAIFRSIKTYPPTIICYTSCNRSLGLHQVSASVNLRQVAAACSKPESMDKNPNSQAGDVMSHSFGEGYSTRSDEEGFGGIYGGNQSKACKEVEEDDKGKIHENHPDYDKSQGSEVKEKEKARHQKEANC